MKTMKYKSMLLIAFLILSTAPAAWARHSLPRLKVRNLSGQRESLSQVAGKSKIVVLNFWATWCVPCRAEMPMLVKEAARFRKRGVRVIGVSVDDPVNKAKIRRFINQYHIDFPIWVGGTVGDLGRWKLGPAIPATAFIENGKIVGRVKGEMHQTSFVHRIEWLLGNHQGKPPKQVQNDLHAK